MIARVASLLPFSRKEDGHTHCKFDGGLCSQERLYVETVTAASADIQARDGRAQAFGLGGGFAAGKEQVSFRRDGEDPAGPRSVYGKSAAVLSVLAQVDQVAPTDSSVLLIGETGTGKEVFAAQIHDRSARRGRPMVCVNCSAIPATLIESELFGREKGAFTGAIARQIGRFELADHSTIFLDEIGDLPPEVQVKLLRVLEERQIDRLGSPKGVPVDVRIIAATHRDLERRIADGQFREDLFYRLNVFPIRVPPLRERVGRHSRDGMALRRAVLAGVRQTDRRHSAREPRRCCSAMPGRATSASCATSSNAR